MTTERRASPAQARLSLRSCLNGSRAGRHAAIHPAHQENNRYEVAGVGYRFCQRRVAIVAKQRLEELAERGRFGDHGVEVVNVLEDGWNPAQLVELVDG